MVHEPGRRLRAAAHSLVVIAVLGAAALASVCLAPSVARATHFRYGHITWVPKPGPPRTVEFTIQGVWRRDAYGNGSGLNRCVTATNPPVNGSCTGAGGFAGVGDIIHETQGDTTFDFGDGSADVRGDHRRPEGPALPGHLGRPDQQLALRPRRRPHNLGMMGPIDTTIEHTYGGMATSITAKIEDCCRISPCANPNAHLNNPDNGYRVTTTVDFTPGLRQQFAGVERAADRPLPAERAVQLPGSGIRQ